MVIPEGFQHILRVLNTNIDGRHKVMYGLTAIKVRTGDGFWLIVSEFDPSL